MKCFCSRPLFYILVAGVLLALTLALFTGEVQAQEVTVERIFGADRYETAVEISKSGWEEAEWIILARADDFPDALAGTPLAYHKEGPILLTGREELKSQTREEIKRLGAQGAVILGGTAAVSDQVEEELREMNLEVERIGGEDRYETAKLVAENLLSDTQRAVIAYGEYFPDALAVAPYAARRGYPVLLTQKEQVPQATREALEALKVTDTLVIGGEAVISEEVFQELPAPIRVAGADRYETASEIIRRFDIPKDKAYVAAGTGFADALTGSVLAARNEMPVILVRQASLPSSVRHLLDAERFNHFIILGGGRAVSPAVMWALEGRPSEIPEDYREDPVVSLLKKEFGEVKEILGEPDDKGYDGRFGGVDYLRYQEKGLFIMSPHYDVEGLDEKVVNAILMDKDREIFQVEVGMTFEEIGGILGAPDYGPSLDERTRDYYTIWYSFGEMDNQFPEFELFFSAQNPDAPTFEAFLTWNYVTHPEVNVTPRQRISGAIPGYYDGRLNYLGINEKIGSYSTEFDPGQTGRATNIRLVADSIDGALLAPGQHFSMNETAGPYSRERGFQPAPVFSGGQVITGIGGGVCQNSSTLYNAALLAGLEVTERHSHSLPVGYLPLGRDASVSYGVTDLKFVNSLHKHVYIQMKASGGILTVNVFGTREKEVKISSSIVETINPPVNYVRSPDVTGRVVVQEGARGYRTVTTITINGQERVLSRDYYRPRERIIKIPL
ncbi:MAG: hypothetical protein D5R97_02925 [Candidatus Syntrophonatronum acetioxidans]|uniref:G5 domain-containing protein n=1 Tax=Candidatus Syntrophonatronum acetioxidans TaxID=1795816 RepID=A0A424YGQ6_9FIRM|nr:MAG: hypothetical protein D5R97_02925 [Candidatus Syntrophonatronum acetioxidans]